MNVKMMLGLTAVADCSSLRAGRTRERSVAGQPGIALRCRAKPRREPPRCAGIAAGIGITVGTPPLPPVTGVTATGDRGELTTIRSCKQAQHAGLFLEYRRSMRALARCRSRIHDAFQIGILNF